MLSHFLSSILVLFSLLLSTNVALDGFSVGLIHRDSPNSPYHNPVATSFDRLRAACLRSTSRAGYLHKSLSMTNGSFQSTVRSGNGDYLMELSIGSPPSKFLLMADTGSDLTWTECQPCTECFKPNTPPFSPTNSSTYRAVPCQSDVCQNLGDASCSDTNNTCVYDIVYGDQSKSSGILSDETFTFESTNYKSQAVSIPKMVFGCSHFADGTFDNNTSGIFGLGRGPSSLITQISSTIDGKFSYCLVPPTNHTASSVLNFGNRAVINNSDVVSTPLIDGQESTYYYVTLEEIVVGEDGYTIIVNRGSEGSSPVQGNMGVDTSTALTLLDQTTMDQLESKLSSMVKLPLVKVEELSLCFNSTLLSPGDLPDITFKFTGASVKLSPENTFVQFAEGVMCLAMGSNDQVLIYGNIAQNNFHVAYDLEAKKLSFAPADCANL